MMVNDRRMGLHRSDIERAVSHYGITEAEYLANPDAYPLPERGTGLNPGAAIGWGGLAIIGLLILALFSRRK